MIPLTKEDLDFEVQAALAWHDDDAHATIATLLEDHPAFAEAVGPDRGCDEPRHDARMDADAGTEMNMRHRRGISLAPPGDYAIDLAHETLGSLPEMYVLVAACPACLKNSSIDRWELGRQVGKRITLANLAKRLKCSGCGNHASNRFLIGKLPRD